MLIVTANPDGALDYLERTKQRIFAGMREGMQEAMDTLAGGAVQEAAAAGVRARTGQLFSDILASPRIRETADAIRGTISTASEMTSGGRKFKGYLGTAIDEGFHVRAVQARSPYEFTDADGETFFTRGHIAFDVKPHPFLRRTKEAFTQPIFDIIEARVAEAIE